MAWILTKYLVTAAILVAVSEAAKRSDRLGGFVGIGGAEGNPMKSCCIKAIVAVTALGSLGCSGAPDVKVGAILPLSGPGAPYEQLYGAPPNTCAAHGYDAMKILALAIQEAGTIPGEVRFYLHSMNPYEGVTGATDFNEQGNVRKFHTILKVVGGQVIKSGDGSRLRE